MAEKEIDLTQDGGKLKRQKDIYHHGPKPYQSFATFQIRLVLIGHYL
jgi:hypothetical protein